ncbi:hypothetical protein C8T65DRAFT_827727 [Cerioporus squamosus]|nr:hypothetical protein C8T65DRAFT_827727 [Cerioporus squamosus]
MPQPLISASLAPPGGGPTLLELRSMSFGLLPITVAEPPLSRANSAHYLPRSVPLPGVSHHKPLSTAPVILASHPSRVWQGIAPELAERDPALQYATQDEPPESRRDVSRPILHSPLSESADKTRASSARTEEVPPPRRSLRNKPVVEIRTHPKRARHTGKRTRRATSISKDPPSDTEFVPSERDAESDSDAENKTEAEEPPKKRKRANASGLRPPKPRRTSASASTPKARPTAAVDYSRRTDYERRAFTSLHGDIRCIFCPVVSGVRPGGTIHRLPDAAQRHLRDFCAHFEKSHAYQKHRAAGLSKEDIVSRLVRHYEKIAVAQVHCRQNEDYRRRCAALGLSPANVESKLARHAELYKIEDCDCCPLPSYSKYLASHEIAQDTKSAGEKGKGEGKRPKATKSKEALGKRREVIEISDDDDAVVECGEVVEVNREDVKTGDAGGERDVVDAGGEDAVVKQKGKVKRLKAAKSEEVQGRRRNVIAISDDKHGVVEDEEAVGIIREDIQMEDAVGEGEVGDPGVEEVQVKEEVKKEVKEEEEITIREVHIKLKNTRPRVKKEQGIKVEESVKQEEETRTMPSTRSRRARTKLEHA